MPLSQESRRARAKLARASQSDQAVPPAKLEELRRDYRFTAAADYIRETVDSAPPLTDEQRRSLADLLVDGGSA